MNKIMPHQRIRQGKVRMKFIDDAFLLPLFHGKIILSTLETIKKNAF